MTDDDKQTTILSNYGDLRTGRRSPQISEEKFLAEAQNHENKSFHHCSDNVKKPRHFTVIFSV